MPTGRDTNKVGETNLLNEGMRVLVVPQRFAKQMMMNFLYDDLSDFWHGHVPYNCAVNVIEGKK